MNQTQEKWLKSFFGLAFLDSSDVEDCFGDDVMRVLPEDPRCTSFADYLLENYLHMLLFEFLTEHLRK
jgi:hypothetical protein